VITPCEATMIDLRSFRDSLPDEPLPTTHAEIVSAGWAIMEDTGFLGHVGPVYTKPHGDILRSGFLAEAKHRNRRDVVQGGMIMTFADRGLALAGRRAIHNGPQATVQLDTHFISPGHLGEFIECASTVVRKTRTLMFISGVVFSGDRLIASANGIWKILKP
jgi:acyl-coenzyme A thioesterase PaaI-like protein